MSRLGSLFTSTKSTQRTSSAVHSISTQPSQATETNVQNEIDSSNGAEATASYFLSNEKFYKDDLSLQAPSDRPVIRVLQIGPGDHLDPLSCHTKTPSPGEEDLEYDALSYCWGKHSISQWRTINVNGRSGFYVTKHLLQELRRLRHKNRTHLVWIDAICINQTNVQERNQQVQVMRSIYKHARAVIIWLGELDENEPSCEKRPAELGDGKNNQSGVLVCAEAGLSAVEHRDVGRVLEEKLRLDERKSLRRSSLGEVWWKRIWVLQEYAASRWLPMVYFGPHTIQWQFLADVLWKKKDHPFMGLRDQDHRSLYKLLCSTTNSFYSSEPKDKIYALLGLIENNADPSTKTVPIIQPDYAKPLSQVYEETTCYLIETEKTLDILLDRRLRRSSNPFPSWIPDTSQANIRTVTVSLDSFQASNHALPQVRLESAPIQLQAAAECSCSTEMALCVRGIHFDKVVHSVSTTDDCIKPKTIFRSAKVNWESLLSVLLSPVISTRISSIDARSRLDRTPSIGYLLLKYLWEDSRSIVKCLEDEVRMVTQDKGPPPSRMAITESDIRKIHRAVGARVSGNLTSRYHNDGELQMCEYHLEAYARDQNIAIKKGLKIDLKIAARCEFDLVRKMTRASTEGGMPMPSARSEASFFNTERGYVGLGPPDMQPGDEVVVLFGASRPFVLRSHGSHYVLIGDAVVPGIMSGQLMRLYEDGSLQAAEFLLK